MTISKEFHQVRVTDNQTGEYAIYNLRMRKFAFPRGTTKEDIPKDVDRLLRYLRMHGAILQDGEVSAVRHYRRDDTLKMTENYREDIKTGESEYDDQGRKIKSVDLSDGKPYFEYEYDPVTGRCDVEIRHVNDTECDVKYCLRSNTDKGEEITVRAHYVNGQLQDDRDSGPAVEIDYEEFSCYVHYVNGCITDNGNKAAVEITTIDSADSEEELPFVEMYFQNGVLNNPAPQYPAIWVYHPKTIGRWFEVHYQNGVLGNDNPDIPTVYEFNSEGGLKRLHYYNNGHFVKVTDSFDSASSVDPGLPQIFAELERAAPGLGVLFSVLQPMLPPIQANVGKKSELPNYVRQQFVHSR